MWLEDRQLVQYNYHCIELNSLVKRFYKLSLKYIIYLINLWIIYLFERVEVRLLKPFVSPRLLIKIAIINSKVIKLHLFIFYQRY